MRIVGCFLEHDGKFAILRRHDHKPHGGDWALPAGKIEAGEDDKTAAVRELFEETGYQASPDELEHLGDFDFPGLDQPYTFVTYRIRLNHPHKLVLEDSAHAEYRWVTGKECYAIPNLIVDLHDLLKRTGYA